MSLDHDIIFFEITWKKKFKKKLRKVLNTFENIMKNGAFAFSIIFLNTLYFKGVKRRYYGVKGSLAYVITLKAPRKKCI